MVKNGPNNSNSRSTLRVRIEENIETRNCYCNQIDYDDDNEKVDDYNENDADAHDCEDSDREA